MKKILARLGYLPAGLLLALTLILSLQAVRYERNERIAAVERAMSALKQTLKARLTGNEEFLYGVRALFEGSSEVSLEEFRAAVSPLLERHTDIRAIVWAPRVSGDEREAFEALGRVAFPSFGITDRGLDGVMRPAVRRDLHFPVFYMTPYRGNEKALGFDLYSEPARREALARSIRDDKPAYTAPLQLVLKEKGSVGVLVVLPVNARRGPNPDGFVLAAFRSADLIGDLLDQGFRESFVVSIRDAAVAEPVLYASEPGGAQESSDRYVVRSSLQIDGERTWALEMRALTGGRAFQTIPLAVVVALAGGIVTVLAFVIEWLIQSRAKEVEAQVEKKTQELRYLKSEFERLSVTDPLTGLSNRRHLEAEIGIEWKSCRRNREPVALVVVDIDDFKKFNDHFGHREGDECLRRVAETLQRAAPRPRDFVARYGGEEFVLLLPDTGEACEIVAERCRAAIDALRIRQAPGAAHRVVTISAGCCYSIDCAAEFDELMDFADQALYAAKAAGKNRIKVCDSMANEGRAASA